MVLSSGAHQRDQSHAQGKAEHGEDQPLDERFWVFPVLQDGMGGVRFGWICYWRVLKQVFPKFCCLLFYAKPKCVILGYL